MEEWGLKIEGISALLADSTDISLKSWIAVSDSEISFSLSVCSKCSRFVLT